MEATSFPVKRNGTPGENHWKTHEKTTNHHVYRILYAYLSRNGQLSTVMLNNRYVLWIELMDANLWPIVHGPCHLSTRLRILNHFSDRYSHSVSHDM
jgi:hypothetical protein